LEFRSDLTLEFQGGEPLLNFDLVQFIVPRAKRRAVESGKGLDIVVATNLAMATDDMLHDFRDEQIEITMISYDRQDRIWKQWEGGSDYYSANLA
jgi:sulfatase maturation enzyme AslB (radical SAM superfamily)